MRAITERNSSLCSMLTYPTVFFFLFHYFLILIIKEELKLFLAIFNLIKKKKNILKMFVNLNTASSSSSKEERIKGVENVIITFVGRFFNFSSRCCWLLLHIIYEWEFFVWINKYPTSDLLSMPITHLRRKKWF